MGGCRFIRAHFPVAREGKMGSDTRMANEWMSIREVKEAGAAAGAPVWCQVEAVRRKLTKNGKPYLDILLRDAGDSATLKVWEDSPAFAAAEGLRSGQFVEIAGDWTVGQFGLECQNWQARELGESQTAVLLAGTGELAERQARDWDEINEFVTGIRDPRLRTLCRWFIEEYGERFRRTAAARDYHHARRGGLVEHVAQMMRCGDAICGAYPGLNRDLLLAGILFHDCGKLWENSFPEKSFAMPVTEAGELLGHIPVGMELVNRLWRDLMDNEEAADWKQLEPANDQVRLHLLHLIASHHGEYEFGSPTLPRTPEAMVLHHVDNIDAKLEMFDRGYQISPEVGRNIHERVRPLPARMVRPLAHFHFVEPDAEADAGPAAAEPLPADEE
jgi:3'-5' exoribonuclease